jgi:hypothetical protein
MHEPTDRIKRVSCQEVDHKDEKCLDEEWPGEDGKWRRIKCDGGIS